MTQISRQPLPSQVSNQIFDIFLTSLSSLSSPRTVNIFMGDLLSPTEQTMLAKRLAIAYMLQKGYTQRDITHTLRVGLATVSKISLIMQTKNNGYTMIMSHLLKLEKTKDFFAKLDVKLDKLMPPRGVNWSQHYQRIARERAKSQRTF